MTIRFKLSHLCSTNMPAGGSCSLPPAQRRAMERTGRQRREKRLTSVRLSKKGTPGACRPSSRADSSASTNLGDEGHVVAPHFVERHPVQVAQLLLGAAEIVGVVAQGLGLHEEEARIEAAGGGPAA